MPTVYVPRELQTLGKVQVDGQVEVSTTDVELSVRTDAGTALTVITDPDAPLAVRTVDGSTVTASTVSVTATAALIGSSSRITGEIFNAGSTTVHLGGSGVNSTNGYPIAAGARFVLPRAPIYAICASGETGTLKLIEVT